MTLKTLMLAGGMAVMLSLPQPSHAQAIEAQQTPAPTATSGANDPVNAPIDQVDQDVDVQSNVNPDVDDRDASPDVHDRRDASPLSANPGALDRDENATDREDVDRDHRDDTGQRAGDTAVGGSRPRATSGVADPIAPVATPDETAPNAAPRRGRLPRTASPLPLLMLLAAACFAGGGALRLAAVRAR